MSSKSGESGSNVQREVQRELRDGPFIENGDLNGPVTEPPEGSHQWCANPKCNRWVVADHKGCCPDCHRGLPGNSLARKPQNLARKDEILKRLREQFPPDNIIEEGKRETLATCMERLETLKPGTSEWVRVSTVERELSADLIKRFVAAPAKDESNRLNVVVYLPDNGRSREEIGEPQTPVCELVDAARLFPDYAPTAPSPAAISREIEEEIGKRRDDVATTDLDRWRSQQARVAHAKSLADHTPAATLNHRGVDPATLPEPPPPPPPMIWVVQHGGFGVPVQISETDFNPAKHRRVQ